MSLSNAINNKCKDCIYDSKAPGTWRAQVTICSVNSCPLWEVRPKKTRNIPKSVLLSYGIKSAESK